MSCVGHKLIRPASKLTSAKISSTRHQQRIQLQTACHDKALNNQPNKSTKLRVMSSKDSFSLFASLPVDVRLLIWEHVVPQGRHLKLAGGRIEHLYAVPRSWSLRPPTQLLGTCRESRKVALSHGCFRVAEGEVGEYLCTWIDKRVGSVCIFNRPQVVDKLALVSRHTNVDVVSTLWPQHNWLKHTMSQIAEKRRVQRTLTTRTIYLGLSAIIIDEDTLNEEMGGGSSGKQSFFGADDLRIVTLDDNCLSDVVEAAYNAAKKTRPRSLYHRSATCYLENLKSHWISGARTTKYRDAAQALGLEVVPVIFFGTTNHAVFPALCWDARQHDHERRNGLLFTKNDMPRVISRLWENLDLDCVDMMYDCETQCSQGHWS